MLMARADGRTRQRLCSVLDHLGMRRTRPPTVLLAAGLMGSVPASYLVARIFRGVDLRERAGGTVSGTALFEVAGFRPLVVSGLFELAKGAVGPLLAGRSRPALAAASVAVAEIGHNWSPFLRGRGGRGSSVALGAACVAAPEGVVVLGLGMGLGRLLRKTAQGNFVSLACLPVVLSHTRGSAGRSLAIAMVLPALVKRLLGNTTDLPRDRKMFVERLVFDRDVAP